jgi:hypothetical protein
MPALLTVAEILDGAADVIERNGWIQKDLFDSESAPGVPAKDCPVCARGGISVAAGQVPWFSADWPMTAEFVHESGSEIAVPSSVAALDAITTAEVAFAEHIRSLGFNVSGIPGAELIEKWNDRDGMSQAIVIAELRACAANNLRKRGTR